MQKKQQKTSANSTSKTLNTTINDTVESSAQNTLNAAINVDTVEVETLETSAPNRILRNRKAIANKSPTISVPQQCIESTPEKQSAIFENLLAHVEELGKEIRTFYSGGGRFAQQENLKRSLRTAKSLVHECMRENRRKERLSKKKSKKKNKMKMKMKKEKDKKKETLA